MRLITAGFPLRDWQYTEPKQVENAFQMAVFVILNAGHVQLDICPVLTVEPTFK